MRWSIALRPLVAFALVASLCLLVGSVAWFQVQSLDPGTRMPVSQAPAPSQIREPGNHPMDKQIRLAQLINAYHEIIRRSLPRRPTWWGFISYFFLQRHEALGHSWTLWRLEKEIRGFGDPRVHFALNCGAVSCPPIREYDPIALDQQLALATRNYLASDQAVRMDVRNKTVYLSPLFKWYRKDFGEPLKFIARYLTPDQLDLLHQVGPSPRIRYLPWNWGPATSP